MNGWLQDVRFALRQIRKNPGFAATAIVVLALGLGATTGMLAIDRAARNVDGRRRTGVRFNWIAFRREVDPQLLVGDNSP